MDCSERTILHVRPQLFSASITVIMYIMYVYIRNLYIFISASSPCVTNFTDPHHRAQLLFTAIHAIPVSARDVLVFFPSLKYSPAFSDTAATLLKSYSRSRRTTLSDEKDRYTISVCIDGPYNFPNTSFTLSFAFLNNTLCEPHVYISYIYLALNERNPFSTVRFPLVLGNFFNIWCNCMRHPIYKLVIHESTIHQY